MMDQMDISDPSDLGKMDPAIGDASDIDNGNLTELSAQSKQAFVEIKEALDAGGMSKAEVLQFEKMIGTDIESLLTFMKDAEKGGMINGNTMKHLLGSDIKEILHVFRRLVDLKKS